MLKSHLKSFAQHGLRVLLVVRKTLDKSAFRKWHIKYLKAQKLVNGRQQKLEELAEEIEFDMRLVGASAIEDRLQDHVPETIEALANAGLKIWMLTGDKTETAINIGHSCNLLNETMRIRKLTAKTADESIKILCGLVSSLIGAEKWNTTKVNPNLAIVIDGKSLGFILPDSLYSATELPNHSQLFLDLVKQCKVVIACRVSPIQKALLVRCIKKFSYPPPMTLAIGDGANDVGMIQEANVGVGISGHEGMHAVQSSDYAIAQFRFLQKLLLYHGRANYQRVALVVLYSFYKHCICLFPLSLLFS